MEASRRRREVPRHGRSAWVGLAGSGACAVAEMVFVEERLIARWPLRRTSGWVEVERGRGALLLLAIVLGVHVGAVWPYLL